MRLVIQGQKLLPEHLAHLSALAGQRTFQPLAEHAYVLADTAPNAEISAYCESNSLDCAFVDDAHTWDGIGLVVMDMDSTLISIECIDEIADMQGLKPQVAAITESAMRGEIEFAESLRRRVALLAGLDQSALQRVYDERLQLNPGAETLLGALQEVVGRPLNEWAGGNPDVWIATIDEALAWDAANASNGHSAPR